MTTTLGGITFNDREVQRISSSKVCEQLVFGIPFEDAGATEVFNWGGNIRRFTINGNVYEDDYNTARTRWNEIHSLISSEQESIAFYFPLEPSGIFVKVENIECWSDANAIPNGHFAFVINLVQSAV